MERRGYAGAAGAGPRTWFRPAFESESGWSHGDRALQLPEPVAGVGSVHRPVRIPQPLAGARSADQPARAPVRRRAVDQRRELGPGRQHRGERGRVGSHRRGPRDDPRRPGDRGGEQPPHHPRREVRRAEGGRGQQEVPRLGAALRQLRAELHAPAHRARRGDRGRLPRRRSDGPDAQGEEPQGPDRCARGCRASGCDDDVRIARLPAGPCAKRGEGVGERASPRPRFRFQLRSTSCRSCSARPGFAAASTDPGSSPTGEPSTRLTTPPALWISSTPAM